MFCDDSFQVNEPSSQSNPRTFNALSNSTILPPKILRKDLILFLITTTTRFIKSRNIFCRNMQTWGPSIQKYPNREMASFSSLQNSGSTSFAQFFSFFCRKSSSAKALYFPKKITIGNHKIILQTYSIVFQY